MKVLKDLKKKPKKVIVNLRVTPEEKQFIKQQAEKYSGGNITKIVKHAVMSFRSDCRKRIEDM